MRWNHKMLMGLLLGTFLPIALICGAIAPLRAQTTEYVVIDPITGTAIYGYDPVAYFVDQQAILGHPAFEVKWRGASWTFVNAANADRFHEAPDFYAPCFNGYGAMALADGKTADGNPLIWAIYENRLYFFYSAEARAKWVVDVAANVEAANSNWGQLAKDLAR